MYTTIIYQLEAQADRIQRALAALKDGDSPALRRGPRGPRTPEQRAAQSEKMKAYWAARKAAQNGGRKGRRQG